MITAAEKGRNLVLTVGDDDGNVQVVVPPVPSKTGAALFALWVGVVFGQSDQAETDADAMARMALGEDNWAVVEDLRYAESEAVINAAIFWNTQGGGIDLVNEMLQAGYPKARQTLCERSGLGEMYSQLTTFLNGASGSLTLAQADTPDTGTPIGTSGSFGKTSNPTTDPA